MTINARKTILATLVAALSVAPLALAPMHAQAQDPTQEQAQAPHVFSQAELDQMLAPIALYPDALLSQVLMAATYPIEVVQAARWTRSNPGLRGDAAVRAVQNEDWDPSVKSLVAFPQILQRMDEQLTWTESLGDAFLAQEPAVMDTIQQLRQRAQAAGNLQSSEQVHVAQQGQAIVVQSPPEVVYVPYYDPLVVYGTWWWPAYPPVVWAPWPGYARPYHPGVSIGFWWGQPVGLSVGFFFGNFDWHHRHVRVVHPTAYYYRPPVVVVNRTTVINRNVTVARDAWQHDPHHRRGVRYHAPEVRARFVDAPRAQPVPRAQAAPRPARVQPAPQPATPQARPEPRPEAQKVNRRPDGNQARREAQEQARKERAAQREAQRQAAPRPQPQAQPAQRQAAPRPQPQAQPAPRQVERRPQPQAQPAPRQAEPRPQPQAQPAPRQAEPRAQPQSRQERRDERRQEQHGDRGNRGNSGRS